MEGHGPGRGDCATGLFEADAGASGVLTRSIYFCQSFDGSNSAAALQQFLPGPLASGSWGKLAYWLDATFKGGSPNLFPNGSVGPIKVADLALIVDGKQPSLLDDFQITSDGSGTQLLLKIVSAEDFTWSIGSAAGMGASVLLQIGTGYIVQLTHSYLPLFIAAGCAYVSALAVVHALSPKLAPAELG